MTQRSTTRSQKISTRVLCAADSLEMTSLSTTGSVATWTMESTISKRQAMPNTARRIDRVESVRVLRSSPITSNLQSHSDKK